MRTTLAWLSTTPRGWPVLPDVYWMNATSSAAAVGNGGGGVVHLEIARLEHVPDVGRGGLRLSSTPGRNQPMVTTALGLGVAEDAGGRLDAEGGVERHRHRAEAQGAEERVEELRAGGIDQAHLVAAVDAGAPEPGRVARALPPETAVRHRLVEEVEVRGVGIPGGPAPHQLGQGGRDRALLASRRHSSECAADGELGD